MTTQVLDVMAATAAEEFRQLALKMAEGGDEPDQMEVREVLLLSGRSPADLKAVVLRLQQRKEAIATLAEAVDYDREVPELENQLRQLEAEGQSAAVQHNWRIAQLQQKWREIEAYKKDLKRGKRHMVSSSRETLQRTADPKIVARIKSLGDSIYDRNQTLQNGNSFTAGEPAIQKELGELTSEVDRLTKIFDEKGMDHPPDLQNKRARASQLQSKLNAIEKFKADMQPVRDELAELHQQLAAAQAELDDWRSTAF